MISALVTVIPESGIANLKTNETERCEMYCVKERLVEWSTYNESNEKSQFYEALKHCVGFIFFEMGNRLTFFAVDIYCYIKYDKNQIKIIMTKKTKINTYLMKYLKNLIKHYVGASLEKMKFSFCVISLVI